MRTYNSIISACSTAGEPEVGRAVYRRLVDAGKVPTATTFTALISAYGKAGQLDQAMEMFQVRHLHAAEAEGMPECLSFRGAADGTQICTALYHPSDTCVRTLSSQVVLPAATSRCCYRDSM